MTTDTPQFVSRSQLKVFAGTLISRTTGMARDVVMAFCFGTSPALAAFLLAYRFIYLLRRLLGETLLHQGFIPHFEEIRKKDPKQGALFFRDLFVSMVLVIGGVILLGEGALVLIRGQTALLSSLLLPGVFFICLFGLTSALLQSEKSFFLPSASPAIFNLIWIVGVLALQHLPMKTAILDLALILSFALFVQWGLTMPQTWRYLTRHLTFKDCIAPKPFSSELKVLVRPLLLGMLGIASVQVNSAIDGVFGRLASPEGPAYLWYAIRLQQLPLALFGLALSSALLPSLSRAIQEQNETRYFQLFQFAEERTFTLIFPCVVGIFVLGASSVNVLFGRGDFGHQSTVQTTLCLWGYGLALLPYALVQILAPAFYAKKDYATPAKAFATSTALNIVLNGILVWGLKCGPSSIALTTAFSALYNLVFLYRRLGTLPSITRTMKYVCCAALFAGVVAFIFDRSVFGPLFLFPRNFGRQLLEFLLPCALYFGIFFATCRWKKVRFSL